MGRRRARGPGRARGAACDATVLRDRSASPAGDTSQLRWWETTWSSGISPYSIRLGTRARTAGGAGCGGGLSRRVVAIARATVIPLRKVDPSHPLGHPLGHPLDHPLAIPPAAQ